MTPAQMRATWRARFRDGLQKNLSPKQVLAAFEGGSAATGRSDDFSDIDLYVVAEAAVHERVFEVLEAIIDAADTIVHRWQVAELPWPGMTQRFYLLAGAPPYFMLDCLAVTPASLPILLERERHGEPQVLFDHAGIVRALPLDRSVWLVKRSRRLEQIRTSWPIYRLLLDKELERGRPLDAFGFHLNLLRLTVELAGLLHRPDRFDFGWRYLHTDLPPALAAELETLAFCSSVEALRARLPRLDALHARLLAALSERSGPALSSE